MIRFHSRSCPSGVARPPSHASVPLLLPKIAPWKALNDDGARPAARLSLRADDHVLRFILPPADAPDAQDAQRVLRPSLRRTARSASATRPCSTNLIPSATLEQQAADDEYAQILREGGAMARNACSATTTRSSSARARSSIARFRSLALKWNDSRSKKNWKWQINVGRNRARSACVACRGRQDRDLQRADRQAASERQRTRHDGGPRDRARCAEGDPRERLGRQQAAHG